MATVPYRGGGVAPVPYRGAFGDPRPPELSRLALPPDPMPSRQGLRPLKAWRYVGVYGPEVMLCAAMVRIGRARQSFWAVWDREHLCEQTHFGRGQITMPPGRLIVAGCIDLTLEEVAGVETVCPTGDSYAWTRKQGGVAARGTVMGRNVDARAVIDDTAAYYERHTAWSWSAGVGRAQDGRELAWNLVSGVNDPPTNSERTVWIDGKPHEAPPCTIASDLSAVNGLRFHSEAVRERGENLILIRSRYRQPFGTFSGQLPGGTQLAEGYGVMEAHDVWW